MTPEEGNKLIVEFMGWRQDSQGFWLGCPKAAHFKLTFDSSWDELMPVVEKIEKGLDLGMSVVIKNNLCKIYRHKGSPYEVVITPLAEEATKIQSTYLAVIHFIQWYNKPLPNDPR